jgi:6,7-dimethyl-8-ribityllumazine synthase
MSGAATRDSALRGSGLRIAVVRARFNEPVTAGLLDGALARLRELDAEVAAVVEAPGAFELPLMAARLAAGGCDAVVALGAVIEGETDHYEHVAHRASEGLMRVMLDTGVPVTFGILTTRSAEHAMARAQPGPDNKGAEAAEAAVQAALALRELS